MSSIYRWPLLAAMVVSMPVAAAELTVGIEIPQLRVAEYHRPYVAVWIEDGSGRAVADLAVWYLQKDTAEGHGTKWLPDLRQWWRKSGRNRSLPIDGVTGATRAAGRHRLSFAADQPPLSDLDEGDYQLVVEAAREVGGRELLRIPFPWPAQAAHSGSAQGESELGRVDLAISP